MKIMGFVLAILFYSIGMFGLFYMILSLGNLLPFTQIDGPIVKSTGFAIAINISMMIAFGAIHSIMARKSFKEQWTKWVPRYLERSVYVLVSGVTLFLMIYFWEPISGGLWHFEKGHYMYYFMYGASFLGWGIMVCSTFQVNHFDIFGLRQAFLHMKGKLITPVPFKSTFLYQMVRHPLYLGLLMGTWFTPSMTLTHLVFAISVTVYVVIGSTLEEKDLLKEFGSKYMEYKKRIPRFIPFLKLGK